MCPSGVSTSLFIPFPDSLFLGSTYIALWACFRLHAWQRAFCMAFFFVCFCLVACFVSVCVFWDQAQWERGIIGFFCLYMGVGCWV